LANPGALGLGAFALTTFVLNIVNAGIISTDNIGMVLPIGLFYGGLAQFMAGMWEVKRGDTFGATCFTSFGAFWIAVATMIILEDAGVIGPVAREGLAILFIAWGIFTLYATIASLRLARGVTAVFVLLTILFFLLAAGEWNSTIHKVAGYEGIITAAVAWYCSAGILINTLFEREVLPLGKPLAPALGKAPELSKQEEPERTKRAV
jgi:succinate-acetate transporter protein